MKRVKWWLETGFVAATHEGEFEIEDDATDEEIEQMAKEHAFNNIDWGYEVERCSCCKFGESLKSGMKCSNCGREL